MLHPVHPSSILHQIGIWFIDKLPRCEDLFTPGDAVDFQRLQRRDSQKLEAVRSGSKRFEAPDLHGFFAKKFGIEFWGARLGDGVAFGAPGDQKSSGRRGWEALGAVIPRVGGYRGVVLKQCDKSRSWVHLIKQFRDIPGKKVGGWKHVFFGFRLRKELIGVLLY